MRRFGSGLFLWWVLAAFAAPQLVLHVHDSELPSAGQRLLLKAPGAGESDGSAPRLSSTCPWCLLLRDSPTASSSPQRTTTLAVAARPVCPDTGRVAPAAVFAAGISPRAPPEI
jgi:hypothetical protein